MASARWAMCTANAAKSSAAVSAVSKRLSRAPRKARRYQPSTTTGAKASGITSALTQATPVSAASASVTSAERRVLPRPWLLSVRWTR